MMIITLKILRCYKILKITICKFKHPLKELLNF